MKLLFAFAVFALVAVVAAPQAAANAQFCHTESTVKVSGLVNVADVVICSSHQEEYGEVGDTVSLNMRVSLPNAAFTPTITLTASTPVGCTAGTATTRTISGSTGAAVSYFNTFTTTDSTCLVSLRILIQATSTVVFDSDESFGAFCQCAEGVTVTDDGNGWALTGIPDTQQEIQAIADAVALLQSIGVTVSGNLGVDILNDATDDDLLTTPSTTIGNASTSVIIPDTFTVENQATGFYLPVFLWLFAIFVFLRMAKLLAAGASTIGFLGSLLLQGASPNVGQGFQLIALVVLGIALWLEATMRDRLYQRWFTGEDKPQGS